DTASASSPPGFGPTSLLTQAGHTLIYIKSGQPGRALNRSAGTLALKGKGGIAMFFFQEGFTYRNFLLDVLTIFFFIVWFWLLITVASDLFRRSDVSGWVKAIWVIGWIVFPFIFMLTYLIFQGRGMAERNEKQARHARDELRKAVGFSAADEIEKL